MKKLYRLIIRNYHALDALKVSFTAVFMETMQPVLSMNRFPTLLELKVAVIMAVKLAGINMMKHVIFKPKSDEKNLASYQVPTQQGIPIPQAVCPEGAGSN